MPLIFDGVGWTLALTSALFAIKRFYYIGALDLTLLLLIIGAVGYPISYLLRERPRGPKPK